MHLDEKKILHFEPEKYFIFDKKFENWVIFKSYIQIDSPKFVDYQKDLIEDFVAWFVEWIQKNDYNTDFIKNNFELWLQNLNTKLKLFADKVNDVDFFSLKGFFMIIVDWILITSIIWEVSLMIFRNNSFYYSSCNDFNEKLKIDIFSDFVEWDIQSGDNIIYIWLNHKSVLDTSDMKELEEIIQSSEKTIVEELNDIFITRVEKEQIWFMIEFSVWDVFWLNKENEKNWNHRKINLRRKKKNLKKVWTKNFFAKNKYYLVIWFLWIIVLFMLYNILTKIMSETKGETFNNWEWVEVLTIDDIKKDINAFKSMPSNLDEKWQKYNEILQKINYLEQKWKRIEDIKKLKKILQSDYHKWFNIIYINNLSQFDDNATNIKTNIFSLNDMEKEKIWDMKQLIWWKNLNIIWSKWSVLGVMNNDMRWYNIEYDESFTNCNNNLMRDGIYCATENWNIFNLTKENWTEPVTTNDEWWFPSNIQWIKIYWKANMYLFQSSLDNSIWNNVLVTRYRNVLWSEIQFQKWQNYKVAISSWDSSLEFGSWLTNFAIDSTFLVWWNGKLYQFWRPEPAIPNLTYRAIPLIWWDTVSTKYSDNVKIISSLNSKYVFLFDKENQTFTVYQSKPVKTNDSFTTDYKLYYMFRFLFDLESSKVVDVEVPEESWNRPELYILSDNWINKVSLYDFIDSIEQDNVLKTVN